ncbi:hypothetical protein QBC44DRAFT_286263 [Cladorrhinum sp. PSN332]|nr:hypothetical protein QBC44DRAFT_286263 [Cladorrhinum sp. PSN332]
MSSSAYTEPIAIVGLACRLPGDITSPSELWDFLAEAKSAQSDIPKNRLNVDGWYHPDGHRAGSINTRGGYFLSDGDSFSQFDPSFFGISPLEAASMDPQQRKLLEVVYESFESAGLRLDEVSGSNTGCFVGNFTWDVGQMQARDVEYGAPYHMTGGGLTILSNRVNYVFNLKGPSLTLDTACSSTMYALHLACKSLQAGDCAAAVVGGTNLIFGIEQQIGSVRLGTLSPTSICHTFDESADGYSRGEAVGAIYIKRLSDAVRDGNPIRAVIRATAINANGKGPGISHPGVADQEVVIRKAYSSAGLGFDKTGYFESHGTGTPVGDPIEFTAIGNVFGSLRDSEDPLLVGSVKTNLGHGEAASAIPSLIKVILSLENSSIPATIGIKKFNPKLNFHGGALKVVQQLTPWPANHTYRRASVNSFGYGGANAHAILDATDSYLSRIMSRASFKRVLQIPFENEGLTNGINGHANGINGHTNGINGDKLRGKTYLVPFSAHNEQTLQKNIEVISKAAQDSLLADAAYTLASKRSLLSSRAYALVSASSAHSKVGQLLLEAAFKTGSADHETPKLAFVFTGQGAQWPRMGMGLIEEYPSVRQTISTLDEILAALPEPPKWTILGTLSDSKATSKINDADRSQTVCTAVQVAVVELLRSWGVDCKASVGHSSGEIAAAFAAGYLTSRQAIIIAYLRGLTVSRNNLPGAMLAVGLGADEVKAHITDIPNIGIACHNSPNSVTLSGTEDAVDEAHGVFSRAGLFSRKLITSRNAYHSRLMKPAGIDYETQLVSQLIAEPSPVRGPDSPIMFSSVTGKKVSASPIPLEYWRENLESPVLFNQAVRALATQMTGLHHFVEIGPHSALGGPIKEIRTKLGKGPEELQYFSAIKRNSDNVENILTLAGSLFLAGYPVDIVSLNDESGSHIVDFPPYQWVYEEDQHYWQESRLSTELRFREYPRHDLLGSAIPGCSKSSPAWRNIIELDALPWLRDHKVGEDVIFPAAGYVSLAITAATQAASTSPDSKPSYTLRNVKISTAMVLKEDVGTEVVVDLKATDAAHNSFEFSVSSVTNSKWTHHAAGSVQVNAAGAASASSPRSGDVKGLTNGINQSTQDRRWYEKMNQVGLVYGPAFKTLSNIQAAADLHGAFANVNLHAAQGTVLQESWYPVHPTAIDGCLQHAIIAAHKADPDRLSKAYLPVAIERMTVFSASANLSSATIRGVGAPQGLRSFKVGFELWDDDSRETLAEAQLSFMSLEGSINSQSASTGRVPQPYSRLVWKPDVDRLTSKDLEGMFADASEAQDAPALFAKLEEVAALSIIDTSERLPADLDTASLPEHMQKFVAWIKSTAVALASSDKPDRRARLEAIANEVTQKVPEAAMLARLNAFMPEIVSGTTGSLDVMIKDNLMTRIYEEGFGQVGAYSKLSRYLELLAHKEPRLNILELGSGTGGATRPMLAALRGKHAVPSYIKYHFTDVSTAFLSSAQEAFKEYNNLEFNLLDIEKDPIAQGFEEASFDIVFASNVIHATRNVTESLQNCKKLLKPGGRLIIVETTVDRPVAGFMLGTLPGYWLGAGDGRPNSPFMSKSSWDQRMRAAGLSGAKVVLDDYPEPSNCTTLMVSRNINTPEPVEPESSEKAQEKQEVWLIYRSTPPPILAKIEALYSSQSISTRSVALTDFPSIGKKNARTILLAELESPLLSQMDAAEMAALQSLTQLATTTVWTINTDVLAGRNPEKALVFGLAKSVMTEQPSFHLSIVDLDDSEDDRSAQLLVDTETRFHQDPNGDMDKELAQKDGVVYISRYISDDEENDNFAKIWQPRAEPALVGARSDLEVAFEKVGRLDSYFFRESESGAEGALEIGETEVRVDVRAFAFDRTGVATAKGQKSLPFFSLEVGGFVAEVGSKVQRIRAGDRVVALKANRFEPSLVVDEALCHLLRPEDAFDHVVSQIAPLVLAAHSLGQSVVPGTEAKVLIDLPTDQVLGAAFTQVASSAGASVRSTPLEFNGGRFQTIVTDGSLSLDILSTIANDGARLFLVSADKSSIDWQALAAVIVSKNLTVTYLDAHSVLRNASSSVSGALAETIRLLQNRVVEPIPSKAFDLSQFVEAAQFADQQQQRAVLTLDPETTVVPIQSLPSPPLTFNSNASYILVGCLGGLGRSLTNWMVSRGARHFIFLSRSGADKAEAASTVAELEYLSTVQNLGLTIQVVRGDVSKRQDVAAAITSAKFPIKGVVQAAMVLKDALFASMSLEQFNSVIRPKVQGSIHLHELLKDQDLDFFVMTSSVLGAIGAATQANYSAANAFLDAMARHRQSLGLQATSIALGMILDVGHVEEHPEVEKALKRNGMYGISHLEYIKTMETACRRRDLSKAPYWGYDNGAGAHIVTGTDPTRVSRAGGKGLWLADNRLRGLVLSMLGAEADKQGAAGGADQASGPTIAARIKDAASSEEGSKGVKALVQQLLMERLSKLVLLPVAKMSAGKPLSLYGMDSMISAELRNWAWKEMRADVPFMSLLDQALTFEGLAEQVVELMDPELKAAS